MIISTSFIYFLLEKRCLWSLGTISWIRTCRHRSEKSVHS